MDGLVEVPMSTMKGWIMDYYIKIKSSLWNECISKVTVIVSQSMWITELIPCVTFQETVEVEHAYLSRELEHIFLGLLQGWRIVIALL